MEVDDESVAKEKGERINLDNYKDSLFTKLIEASTTNFKKCCAQAICIQSMFTNDLPTLLRLFDFYIEKDQLDMALDLVQNTLIKNFDLNKHKEFDFHLNKFSLQIINNLCTRKSIVSMRQLSSKPDPKDEFYFKIYSKLSPASQDLLISKLLDKYRTQFSFLKLFVETDKKQTQHQQLPVDLKDFYFNLAENLNSIFIMKDLLTIFKKHVSEYGLFLIDVFLNIEKHLYATLVQNSAQLKSDSSLISIERRSLNLMRRICVIDLISEFVFLVDKLDNKHCYRWIEKSLEFFTKYSIFSTEITDSKLCYSKCKLLYDTEILLNETTEGENSIDKLTFTKDSLNDLIEYKYEPKSETGLDSNPYYNVYRLLDEIGKKLDWPLIPEPLKIEDKMTYLFNLKSKADKHVSMSALNKQISFYSLAFFFNKLTEFQSINKSIFNDALIIAPLYRTQAESGKKKNQTQTSAENILNSSMQSLAISNLIYCLKIWQKFNQHKEYFTIVTKCLSNSKLDSLICYKTFLTEYYSVFQLALNLSQHSSSWTWTSLANLSYKQKIPIVSYLFINEKDSFKNFFAEMSQILLDSTNIVSKDTHFYSSMVLSKSCIDIFELDKTNLLKYFSKLMTEKLFNLIEQKKSANSINLLANNDLFIGSVFVLLQASKSCSDLSSVNELYEIMFQIVNSKKVFDYPQLFDYIYDVQILQDFLLNLNSNDQAKKPKLEQADLADKFISQLNKFESNNCSKFEIFGNFLLKNLDLYTNLFDQLLKL